MIITVFDWDDTLIPSMNELRNGKQEDFEKIKTNISTLFVLAKACSDKFIILTNADIEWVKLSSNILGLDLQNIEIYSTRSKEFIMGTKDETIFKQLGLMDNFIHIFSDQQPHTLISIGDSEYDRKASLYVKSNYRNVTVKNFKFIHCPTASQLIQEQNLMIAHWPLIVRHKGHLDLELKANDKESALVYL